MKSIKKRLSFHIVVIKLKIERQIHIQSSVGEETRKLAFFKGNFTLFNWFGNEKEQGAKKGVKKGWEKSHPLSKRTSP